jgi:Alpha/beta hydrolase domain
MVFMVYSFVVKRRSDALSLGHEADIGHGEAFLATFTGKVDGTPMGSVVSAIEKVGGVEEEWFFEGDASSFRLVDGGSEYPSDGRWAAERSEQQPFLTRMLVVRPSEATRFNGTVVVNWNNVSAGESFEPAQSAARLVEDGFVLAGVSAQRVGVEGADVAGPPGFEMPALKTGDALRYGALAHPGDDFSFDIFTQAGRLVARDRPGGAGPLEGFAVRHVIATGGSQSAARLMGYFNGVHPLESVFDAFLLTVFPDAPCALNAASAAETLPRMGGPNPFALIDWNGHLLRLDLEAPCIILNSEAEAADCYPNVQPDGDRLRVWEIPGAGHAGTVSSAEFAELGPIAGLPHSEVCFGPAKRAALHLLPQWADGAPPPPVQRRITRGDDPATLARDANGNAIGGIRWPDLEAPLATHRAEAEPGGFPFGLGQTTSFGSEKIRALYPDHASWFAKYKAAVERLVQGQVILPDDAAAMLAGAQAADIFA